MKTPSYFISHGAGPWPFMKQNFFGASHDSLHASLRRIPGELPAKPRAILLISAHWEMPRFTVNAAAAPALLYDYVGFPPETYQVKYPAPGAPDLAHRVESLLQAAGLETARDNQRGLDHGVFVPLSAMYPEADIPVVQLSMKTGYDPATHLAAGRALAPLRDDGVLIIGSGLSYHNANSMRARADGARLASAAFDAWLGETLIDAAPTQRAPRLLNWAGAPGGRASHPSEDHLVPLMMAVGAAESEPAVRVYHETNYLGGATVSSFRFG